MYEFHKNSKGEVTEGYLGNPEDFNGIVFLLMFIGLLMETMKIFVIG